MEAASAGVVAGANGGKHGGFRQRERDHLLHNPQHQLGSALDGQLLEKPVQVHVDGVGRNLESFGDVRLVLIVENALDDLQFALGDVQGAANLVPRMVAEERRSPQLAA